MTRQWLIEPDRMCKRHLLGEHAETHAFIDKMEKGHSLEGFREGSMFFGAEYVVARHNLLVPYIPGHGSPISISHSLKEKYPLVLPEMDDLKKSLLDLLTRCDDCRKLFN